MASPKRVDTHVSTKRVDIRVSTGDEESMLSDFPCPHCKTRFDTRKGVRIHVMRWLCRGGRTRLRLPRFDTIVQAISPQKTVSLQQKKSLTARLARVNTHSGSEGFG